MPNLLSKLISSKLSNPIIHRGSYTSDRDPSHSRDQLRPIYENLGAKMELEQNLMTLFPKIRILVVGRSGSGKSTLIRVLQDIAKAWMIYDDLPRLFIHDTNGTDVQGSKRLGVIEEFLNSKPGMNEPVHLVWYVVSGIDQRLREDGGLLRLLSRKKMPFVMVITHSDCEEIVKDIVTDEVLDRLLEGVEDGEIVKQNIIRVGNRVKILENGQVEMVKVDVEALRRVSERSRRLIDGHLKRTWISRQLIDVTEKLEASADLILQHMIVGGCTSALTLCFALAEIEMLYTFWNITLALCRIWRVPKNFQIALRNTLTMPIIREQALRTLCIGLMGGLVLVGTVTATGMTCGAATAWIVVWLCSFGIANARPAMSARGCYAVVILGCIMYVKAFCGAGEKWDEEKSVEEYMTLCKTFAMSEHRKVLIGFVKKMRDVTELIVGRREQHEKLYEALVETFAKMLT